jgi:integrase
MLAAKSARKRTYARGTVRRVSTTLSAVLREAVEAGVIESNPMQGLWSSLTRGVAAKKQASRRRARDDAKAFTAEEAQRFAKIAETTEPEAWPALATMMLAGLRAGEALAVTEAKLGLGVKVLVVDEQLQHNVGLKAPKDDSAREVDLSAALVEILQAHLARPATARVVGIGNRPLAAGSGERGPFIFARELPGKPSGRASQAAYRRLLEAMRRVLKRAGLPKHLGLHSLRHTYGSGLVSRGASLAYVMQQMGHASISVTVDTYGSWLPVRVPGAVDGLAEDLLGRRGHFVDTSERSVSSK